MGFDIINKLKKEKGLTNAQIANMAGVTLSTLDKITSGVNTNPKLDTLQSICKVLGCRLDDFDDTPNPKNNLSLSDEAKKIALDYDKLDTHGKEMVDIVIEKETERINAVSEIETQPLDVKPKEKTYNLATAARGQKELILTEEQLKAFAKSGNEAPNRAKNNEIP